MYLHTRFISQLNWHLLVEQMEEETIENIYSALVVNLLFCALFTVVAIALTTVTINIYQRITEGQQKEIMDQHNELLEQHAELEKALLKPSSQYPKPYRVNALRGFRLDLRSRFLNETTGPSQTHGTELDPHGE